MVFYRKYRPQTISDLDSEQLKKTLYGLLKPLSESRNPTPVKQANSSFQSSVPHSLLFTGPKGLGKTSTARIVAKIVNCENRGKGLGEREKDKKETGNKELYPSPLTLHVNLEPCNKCEQCLSITNGSNVDVIEIDGASNRGIEEIRDLKEKIRILPSHAKKKIYIIDEVHMLTNEAFNALLKMVEEPPEYVMFIFATTEKEKVPETILSRCFIVNFKKATDEEIVHSLKRIIKGENIKITEDAIMEIARSSDGGFRDAAKYLEEVVNLNKGEITVENVRETLGTKGIEENSLKFLEFVISGNLKNSFSILKTLEASGVEAKYFLSNILDILEKELLVKAGIEEKAILNIDISELFLIIEIFQEANLKLKNAVYSYLPLEMASVQFFLLKGNENTNLPIVSLNTSRIGKKTLDDLIKEEMVIKVKNLINPPEVKKEKPKSTNSQDDLNSPKDLLENLIYKIKSDNFSLAGVLRSFKNYEIRDEQIIFKTKYKFHKDKLSEAKNLNALEKALKELTGKNLKVLVSLE